MTCVVKRLNLFFVCVCVFVLNCGLFSRRQTGDSSRVHSLLSFTRTALSSSVVGLTTHLDFKKPRRRLAGLDTTHVVITFPLEADRFVSIH